MAFYSQLLGYPLMAFFSSVGLLADGFLVSRVECFRNWTHFCRSGIFLWVQFQKIAKLKSNISKWNFWNWSPITIRHIMTCVHCPMAICVSQKSLHPTSQLLSADGFLFSCWLFRFRFFPAIDVHNTATRYDLCRQSRSLAVETNLLHAATSASFQVAEDRS